MIGLKIGPYYVVAKLGEGGMGEVYRARDSKLGRDVALKILPETFAKDTDRIARFRREAQVLASLNHPNIAAIYGLEDAGPVTALVLELVEGPTLADLIAGSRPREPHASSHKPQALSVPDTLAIARQIADALEAAHERGVIHRDLKPANIKVRADGTVKVLDFGLAKALDPAFAANASAGQAGDVANSPTITSPAMTELGMILGTAAYMAPEQAKGRAVDKRADVWAFGCVVYEMITGRPTFRGDDVSDTLANVLKTEPDWGALPADTPTALRRLLRRCLSKDLSGRLSDIGVARLEIADASAPGEALAPSDAVPSRGGGERSRWRDAALVAVGLVLAGIGAVAVGYWRDTAPAPATVRFGVPPAPGTRYPDQGIRSTLSVSPDGRFVAFRAHHRTQQATLWLRALDSLDVRELSGTEVAGSSFWSPDSRSIAFFSAGQLKRIDIASGSIQTISPMSATAGGSWSADGTILVGSQSGGLRRVPAVGGTPVVVTTPDTALKETAHVDPHFLPDGRHFLYTAMPENSVFLASLDSTERTKVINGGSHAMFAPQGYLLFLQQGTLLAQRFDPSRGVLTGEATPVAEQVQTALASQSGVFSISRTGVLAYQPAPGDTGGELVWIDRGGREFGPVAGGFTDVRFPRLSPDGQRLALIRHGDLWVQDLRGRPAIRLTFDEGRVDRFSPLWTPDGGRLLYELQLGPSGSPIRSLMSDGSNSTAAEVSPDGHYHPLTWSPDGRELLAVRLDTGKEDIVAVPVDKKGEPRDVVATQANEGFGGASVSPDGRWLAYAANPTGQYEIWVRPYAGTAASVRVSPNGGVEPVWARSGRELFYLENSRLMAVAIRPGQTFSFSAPTPLFEGSYLHRGQPPTYDVAADGRFLMVKPTGSTDAFTQPFTVVLNWVDELERRLGSR